MTTTADKRLLTLPPAVLVGGSISVRSDGISYEKLDEKVEETSRVDGDKDVATVKTSRRHVRAAEELVRAQDTVRAIRVAMRKVCRSTVIGWISLQSQADDLRTFIEKSKEQAAEHNSGATHHKVRVSLVRAIIATDDERAAREIAGQVNDLLGEFKEALEAADIKAIRDVAVRAKNLSPILDTGDGSVFLSAVDAARRAANKIAKEVEKKGRALEDVRREIDLSPVEVARAAFLEFDGPEELAPPTDVELDREELELDDDDGVDETEAAAPADLVIDPAPAVELELDFDV